MGSSIVNKCIATVWEIGSRGDWAYVVIGVIWELSVIFFEFVCHPMTSPKKGLQIFKSKIKKYIKKKKAHSGFISHYGLIFH